MVAEIAQYLPYEYLSKTNQSVQRRVFQLCHPFAYHMLLKAERADHNFKVEVAGLVREMDLLITKSKTLSDKGCRGSNLRSIVDHGLSELLKVHLSAGIDYQLRTGHNEPLQTSIGGWGSYHHHLLNLVECASIRGHVEVVRLLLDDGRVEPEFVQVIDRMETKSKALLQIFALYLNDRRYSRRRLKHYVGTPLLKIALRHIRGDIDAEGLDALFRAVEERLIDDIALLLSDKRIDPNGIGRHKKTALECSLQSMGWGWEDESKISKLLLASERIDPNVNISELNLNPSAISILLDDGRIDPTGLLNAAVRHSDVKLVKRLLEDSQDDPAAENSKVLVEAVKTGNTGIIKLLIADGRADPYHCGQLSRYQIKQNGDPDTILSLLLADSRFEPLKANFHLQASAEHGLITIVESYLNSGQIEDRIWRQALTSAIDGGSVAAVKLIFKAVDIYSESKIGDLRFGDSESKIGDLRFGDSEQRIDELLKISINSGQVNLLQYLIDHWTDHPINTNNLLWTSIRVDNVDMIEYTLTLFFNSVYIRQDEDQDTDWNLELMKHAIDYERSNVVRHILSCNQLVYEDIDKFELFTHAAGKGNTEIMYLIYDTWLPLADFDDYADYLLPSVISDIEYLLLVIIHENRAHVAKFLLDLISACDDLGDWFGPSADLDPIIEAAASKGYDNIVTVLTQIKTEMVRHGL